MLGNYQGTYFLDDFETSIESTEPLSYYEEILKIIFTPILYLCTSLNQDLGLLFSAAHNYVPL